MLYRKYLFFICWIKRPVSLWFWSSLPSLVTFHLVIFTSRISMYTLVKLFSWKVSLELVIYDWFCMLYIFRKWTDVLSIIIALYGKLWYSFRSMKSLGLYMLLGGCPPTPTHPRPPKKKHFLFYFWCSFLIQFSETWDDVM